MKHSYSRLVKSLKPAQARYLRERREYWFEALLPGEIKEVRNEMERERERALVLRILEAIASAPEFVRETGLNVFEITPGIATVGRRCFDVCLSDGTLTIPVMVIPSTLPARKAVSDFREKQASLTSQGWNGACPESGPVNFQFAIAGLNPLTLERAYRAIRMDAPPDSRLSVLEIDLQRGRLPGLPRSEVPPEKEMERETMLYLPERRIDLGAGDYLLFECAVVEGCYIRHLSEGRKEPKRIEREEIKERLFASAGITDGGKSALREYALKRLEGILSMALDHNLMERMEKESYRLLCQGMEPARVRKSLMHKYLNSEAEKRALRKAEKRAVRDYRRSFPDIEGF